MPQAITPLRQRMIDDMRMRMERPGHLSLGQLKAMSAIERRCSAALGGHALRCDACDQVDIAYNSCRNRPCPKCQANRLAGAIATGAVASIDSHPITGTIQIAIAGGTG